MSKFEFDAGPDKAIYGPQGNQTVYNTGMLGGIVIIANLLFAATMIMAMQRYEFSPILAILLGALYYASTTTIALLIISGALGQMYMSRQEQATIRYRDTLHYRVVPQPALPAADPLHIPSAPAAQSLPGPLGGVTYVAAEDLTTRRNAALWAVTLYGSDGLPNPKMVHLDAKRERPGRLRIAAPAKREREWLENKKVLESIPHGVRLRVERYPDAAMLRSILND